MMMMMMIRFINFPENQLQINIAENSFFPSKFICLATTIHTYNPNTLQKMERELDSLESLWLIRTNWLLKIYGISAET